MNDSIECNSNGLFYFKQGAGQKVILLFHGFGQDHAAYESWVDILKNDYTIYSFDLFFHGKSAWLSDRALEKEDWKKIVELFLQQEGITDFEVAGFSMGGKFAFATVESFPDRVKKIMLIAPDGIKVNFWYGLATYPVLMRGIFETIVSKPKFFFALAKFLQSINVINNYLLRFVMLQMDTEAKRKQVYNVWINFRPLQFNMKTIASLLNEKQIPLKIFVGKFDRVIPAKDMQRLLTHVPNGSLKIIDVGHNHLIEAVKVFLP